MIKLIATDIDGTILPEGTFDLNPEYFEVIRALKEKGILFVAASGRHYTSMRKLFEPVAEDIIFMSGNGSCVRCRDKTMDVRALEYDLYQDALKEMRRYYPDEIMTDRDECVYTDSSDEGLYEWVRDGYRVDLRSCEDVADVEAPILKTAMRTKSDPVPIADEIRKAIGGRARVMAAGACWVDIVSHEADKGKSLLSIQKLMGILPEETAAFGDNDNDIGMLRQAAQGYAVANAREDVKSAAYQVIGPMTEDAVLGVMKSFIT